jgi:spermidine synthase
MASCPKPLGVSSRTAPGLRAAVALIGFSAVTAQIVLLRELLVVFYGNELATGLMLASWLLWTAFGSSILGRRLRRMPPRMLMATLELAIAAALPLTIFAVRASRNFFHALPGEVLGPGAILLTSLAALSLFCSLSGWLFTVGTRLYAAELGAAGAAAGGSVYVTEAAGSAIGGLLVSLVLISHWGAFPIALLAATLNVLAAVWLAVRTGAARWVAAALLLALAAALAPSLSARLEQASLARLWRGLRLLESRDSRFGNLAIIGNEDSRTLYENGLPMFTVPDAAAAEEAVHYALLQHPAPRRLLLIGGGTNGSVSEALKHPSLEHVDYVELDPEVFRLARTYFPGEWQRLSTDPRVRVVEGDGRRFLMTSTGYWDVIVVNLPEPETAQLNRFYTREFFREAQAHLNDGGLLSFQLRSSENYISPERAKFLRCIYRTLHQVFRDVGFIPGETVHFFAGEREAVPNAAELMARLRQRGLQTSYVREYFLPFRMMPDRMAEMRETLEAPSATPVDGDFTPAAYYFDVALWSTQFNQAYRSVFLALGRIRFRGLLAALSAAAVALAAGVFPGARRAPGRRLAAALCVTAMGFTLLGTEVLLLLGFQALYGYLYQRLALLVAMFMAGLAAGGWWALRRNLGARALAGLQLAITAAPLLSYAALLGLARTTVASRLQYDYLGEAAFVALALAAGMVGGLQFPAANRVFCAGATLPASSSAGVLYALDLAGACLGAIAISGYMVPVFGFAKAAVIMAVVAAAPALPALRLE